MSRNYLYLLFFFLGVNCGFAQDPRLVQLSNSVFALKTFEKQQDRYLAINDSLNNKNLFKTEFAFINIFEEACKEKSEARLLATCTISRGNFYLSTGNYFKGIEAFNLAAKMYEKLNQPSGLSIAHANLGNAYYYIDDFKKAQDYYNLAISDYKKIKDKKPDSELKLANCYNSLGSIYCTQGDFVYGRTYFDLAYNIWIKHNDSLSVGYLFNNYALIFLAQNKMDSALIYLNKALQLKLRHGDNFNKADAYNTLADYYFKNKKREAGIENAKKALTFLDTTIYGRQLLLSYGNLTEGYHLLKDFKNELKYYKLLKIAGDSSEKRIQHSEIGRLELRHEFDRIHLSDSIKAVEEIKLKDAKISEKKTQSYFLIFILFLAIVTLSLIYSRFKLTKKQKLIIEQKNKEITDSITYAKKIQQSSLPNEKYIEKEITRLSEKKKG